MIKEKVRYLRKNQTLAESILWEKLRNRQLNGFKFLRQYPIRFVLDNQRRVFIADFYCAKHKLVIELDGEIHEKQKEYDTIRSEIINNLGFSVIRFPNKEIINNIGSVKEQIISHLNKSPLCPVKRDREGI
jgi:very-short-patch-repair endonuclease